MQSRYSREARARDEVSFLARYLMDEHGDAEGMAKLLGIGERTLRDKVRHGRFSAAELVLMAEECGYSMNLEERNPMLLP